MAAFHVYADAHGAATRLDVRSITSRDVFNALARGLEDFRQKPSHYAFLGLIYPIMGFVLITWSSGGNAVELIYPLITGFTLLGPLAAIGLYEISRRRELGLDTSWRHALDVRFSPAMPAILAVALFLLALFLAWVLMAQGIYSSLYGDASPETLGGFVGDVFSTGRGWTLILVGNAVGLVFALVVLLTVIAFPLLLDRDVGAYAAIETSARAVLSNPGPMLLWGLIVAAGLAIGSLPLLAGLIVVVPILGHATWHLYRKLVDAPEAGGRQPPT
ncbi:DUF2189 domain-containing protein [Aquibium oceanicum]|uniref:Cytochrome C oxidase subunit I n=1 Tax=Aquibium oceanicum TaxID=1670800 RepID=A0A1L3SW18_9HYPH|nr:DUF2189 domain-containing protein [Aquibium oceanicum]APH73588.1 hypothetical protein BSQ44_21070 [Aquibium oceanicum]